jgi:hypothetical protein
MLHWLPKFTTFYTSGRVHENKITFSVLTVSKNITINQNCDFFFFFFVTDVVGLTESELTVK